MFRHWVAAITRIHHGAFLIGGAVRQTDVRSRGVLIVVLTCVAKSTLVRAGESRSRAGAAAAVGEPTRSFDASASVASDTLRAQHARRVVSVGAGPVGEPKLRL